MQSIKDFIIQGFNEIVQTIKGIEKQYPEQEHLVTLVTFNGMGQKVLHFIDPVKKLEQIDFSKYNPNASTPLYDAMGFSFTKLKQVLENVKDYNVLVTILTDGEENASVEYSGQAIKKLIEELKQNRWTFTYIGADHDVEKFATSLSITNSMKFDKFGKGLDIMFEQEREARRMYSQRIRDEQSTSDDYYKMNIGLNRFLKAQVNDYDNALTEIKSGRKIGHWMWYIFPQFKGLGYSETSKYYAINDIEEAKEYLKHPILGVRLKEISNELLKLEQSDASLIFGGIDSMKLKSCMTLFWAADKANADIFVKVIDKFFNGKFDDITLSLIKE